MVEIKCRNTKPLGDLYFPTGIFIRFNIDTPIEKPEYPINEDAEEDQEGDTFRLFQRWEKQHKLMFKAVESVCDTCSILPLMDEVYINDTRVFDVFVDIAWDEEFECLADVTITFSSKKIVKTL
jgi:hypothetical protein